MQLVLAPTTQATEALSIEKAGESVAGLIPEGKLFRRELSQLESFESSLRSFESTDATYVPSQTAKEWQTSSKETERSTISESINRTASPSRSQGHSLAQTYLVESAFKSDDISNRVVSAAKNASGLRDDALPQTPVGELEKTPRARREGAEVGGVTSAMPSLGETSFRKEIPQSWNQRRGTGPSQLTSNEAGNTPKDILSPDVHGVHAGAKRSDDMGSSEFHPHERSAEMKKDGQIKAFSSLQKPNLTDQMIAPLSGPGMDRSKSVTHMAKADSPTTEPPFQPAKEHASSTEKLDSTLSKDNRRALVQRQDASLRTQANTSDALALPLKVSVALRGGERSTTAWPDTLTHIVEYKTNQPRNSPPEPRQTLQHVSSCVVNHEAERTSTRKTGGDLAQRLTAARTRFPEPASVGTQPIAQTPQPEIQSNSATLEVKQSVTAAPVQISTGNTFTPGSLTRASDSERPLEHVDLGTALQRNESMETTRRPETQAMRHSHVQHITSQIADAARNLPDGSLELKLSPEELGRVRLSLVPGEGGLTVQIAAEHQSTLDLMRRNIELLQSELRGAGFSSLSFSFTQDDAESDNHQGDHDKAAGAIAVEAENATAIPKHASSGNISSEGRMDVRL